MDRIPLLNQMIEEDSNDPFLYYALGLEHLKQGNKPAAITAFTALQQAHPNYLPTYYQLGILQIESGDLKDAEAVLTAGKTLADTQGERKTAGEIQEALWGLEDLMD